MEETVASQTTETVSAQNTQQSTPAQETTSPIQAAPAEQTTTAQTAAPVYTPNFKFKVVDEEKEFDEFVRPAITSKEVEDKIRDLYTKAHGLEPMKTRLKSELDQWRKEAMEHKTKYSGLNQSLEALSHYVNSGDFDSFFKSLKIPEAAIYKWVNSKIQEQDLPPEQRQALMRNREEASRAYYLERQNQELKERFEKFEVEQNHVRLQSIMNSPEISPIAKAFDERVGEPGAFYNEVLRRGVNHYHMTGQDLPPEQVVQEVVSTLGKLVAPAQTAQAQPQGKPAIIPNISGKNSSPVRQAPKSLDDLKKLTEAMA